MSIFGRDKGSYHGSSVEATPRRPIPTVSEAVIRAASPLPPVAPAPVAEPDLPEPPQVPVDRSAAAVIDKNSEISGTLHSKGNVLVEGCFDGEIEAKETVWVETGAQTRAQLRANDVVISGAFDGEITCDHRVHIAASAVISGEIKTPILVVEEGSHVNCRFNMTRSRRPL